MHIHIYIEGTAHNSNSTFPFALLFISDLTRAPFKSIGVGVFKCGKIHVTDSVRPLRKHREIFKARVTFGVTVFSSWPSRSERGEALTKGMEARFPTKLRRGALSTPPGKTPSGQIPKKTPEQEVGGLQMGTPKATSPCCRFKSSSCFLSFNPATLSLEEVFWKGIVTSL